MVASYETGQRSCSSSRAQVRATLRLLVGALCGCLLTVCLLAQSASLHRVCPVLATFLVCWVLEGH